MAMEKGARTGSSTHAFITDLVLNATCRCDLRQRRDVVWDILDICSRTCPTEDLHLCTYKNWFARPAERHARSLLDLPLSTRCMQRLLRFRVGCHKLPRDTGCWLRVPRLDCVHCTSRVS